MDIKNVLTTMEPPRKRRRRHDEVPIWAQRAPRKRGEPPAIPPEALKFKPRGDWSMMHGGNPGTLPHRSTSGASNHFPGGPAPPSSGAAIATSTSSNTAAAAADAGMRSSMSSIPLTELPPSHARMYSSAGLSQSDDLIRSSTPAVPDSAAASTHFSLNEEPSITGFIPYEETTKVVCDFLYEHVVARTGVNVTGIGEESHHGAVLEIEAKLGRVIDKNRKDRLRLPVMTECVLSRDRRDSAYWLAFESSMTAEQHYSLNQFLNETLRSSHQPDSNRTPLAYIHRKHRDVFYDLPRSRLPPLLQSHTQMRYTPKVRVTYDQKTGAIVSQIIKGRVADLDIHSPRTQVDWRLSVNVEMEYTGSLEELSLSKESVDNTLEDQGDRIKDRMSYLHNAYRIDLTQVQEMRKDHPAAMTNFEHELEVELSSAEVRRLGELAREGDPANQYERLIKGFIDNVRVLSRRLRD